MTNPVELPVQRLEEMITRLGGALMDSQIQCGHLKTQNRRLREIIFVLALYAGAGTAGVVVGALR